MKRSWRCGPGPFRTALNELRRVGGTVTGPESAGTFRADTPLGLLEGSYEFDGEVLTITISKSPPMLPLDQIWSRLDQICGHPIAAA